VPRLAAGGRVRAGAGRDAGAHPPYRPAAQPGEEVREGLDGALPEAAGEVLCPRRQAGSSKGAGAEEAVVGAGPGGQGAQEGGPGAEEGGAGTQEGASKGSAAGAQEAARGKAAALGTASGTKPATPALVLVSSPVLVLVSAVWHCFVVDAIVIGAGV